MGWEKWIKWTITNTSSILRFFYTWSLLARFSARGYISSSRLVQDPRYNFGWIKYVGNDVSRSPCFDFNCASWIVHRELIPSDHRSAPTCYLFPVPCLYGMQITWPIWRLFGFTVGLALWIASTVVLNLIAKFQNVSPDRTV